MSKWSIIVIFALLTSCAALPNQTTIFSHENKIEVGDGPEDFQIDEANNRLIVACDNRRVGYGHGEIWEIDLKTQLPRRLEVIFDQNRPVFHPHGMSIIDDYLFVISHKDKDTEEFFRFKIYNDSVVQDTIFSEGIIGHGNDILAVSKDEFYYSDFKMFGGSIVHYENGAYTKFSKGYKYPNGLIIHQNEMFVTTSLSNNLYVVDLETGKKKKLLKLKGGDNLLSDGKSLFTTSHPKMMKFIKHTKSADNFTPSIIYSINPKSPELEVLFSNEGDKISAGSTGFVYENKLYIGQVFEGFIWVGDIK
jgi:DNA-binding beta-propeller fold protein YncE